MKKTTSVLWTFSVATSVITRNIISVTKIQDPILTNHGLSSTVSAISPSEPSTVSNDINIKKSRNTNVFRNIIHTISTHICEK